MGARGAVGDEHIQRCHQGREDSRRLEKELVGACLQRKGVMLWRVAVTGG